MWTEILSKGLLNPKQPTNQSSLFTGNRHNIYEITELHFNIPFTFVVLQERTLLLQCYRNARYFCSVTGAHVTSVVLPERTLLL